MPLMELAIPRLINGDISAALADLAHIFHDRVPRFTGETARTFFFEIESIHAAQPPKDPDLIDVAKGLLNLQPEDLARWRAIEDDPVSGRRFAVMLEHAHAIEAWCRAPTKQNEEVPTLLIHIDAHDDLNSPSLLPGKDTHTYLAPIGPDVMSLNDPKSVRRFVECGYIGIGGFIAPLLCAKAIDKILHITIWDKNESFYEATLNIDVAPETGFIQVMKQKPNGRGIPYSRMSLDQALTAVECFQGRILLDIDLDAFCNRYDTLGGDNISDPEAREVMTETANILSTSRLLQRSDVTTIALSPGFFPAALWSDAFHFVNIIRSACFSSVTV